VDILCRTRKTLNIQEILRTLDKKEHLYIHNLNQPMELEIGWLHQELTVKPEQLIKAFNLKG